METIDNIGQTRYYQYDSRDNLIVQFNTKGPTGPNFTRRAFPDGPRTVDVTNLPGNATTYTYDGMNRRLSQASVLTHSGAGDGTSAPAPDTTQGGGDGLITLTYGCAANSLTASRTDDNGNQTQYAYDNTNRMVTESIGACVAPHLAAQCVGPKSSTFAHDAAGRFSSMTDRNGSVTQYAYDAANRLISTSVQPAASVAGTTATSYQYDGLGRVTSAFDNNSPGTASDDVTVTDSYDSLGRTIEERQQIGKTAALAVDSAWRGDGLRASLTYPNSRVVTYTYDASDRLATVSDDGASKQLAAYAYIGPDRLLQRSTPIAGTKLTFLNSAGTKDTGYDALGRPVQIRAVGPTHKLILGYGNTFDRTNTPLSKSVLQAPNLSELYSYDSAGRLLAFNRGTLNASQTAITTPSSLKPLQSSFTLDGAGNWTSVDSQIRTFSSYDAILSLTSTGKTTNLTNDANGNTLNGGTFTFAWDAQNRLRAVTRNSVQKLIATYLYDASGRRVEKIVTNSGALNGVTRYLSDGRNEIEERNGTGKLTQQYVYGPGINDPIVLDRNTGGGTTATGPGDQRFFYLRDAQGSIVGLTNATGMLVEGYVYDAYGRPVVYDAGKNGIVDWGKDDVITPGGAGTFGNPFMFTGGRYDVETGLYYDRARYMDPVLGRFLSMDPIGIWGDAMQFGNGYGYVGDSPVATTDPLGMRDSIESSVTSTPPPPAKNPYEHFVVGDYIFSPKVYNEFRPGNTFRPRIPVEPSPENPSPLSYSATQIVDTKVEQPTLPLTEGFVDTKVEQPTLPLTENFRANVTEDWKAVAEAMAGDMAPYAPSQATQSTLPPSAGSLGGTALPLRPPDPKCPQTNGATGDSTGQPPGAGPPGGPDPFQVPYLGTVDPFDPFGLSRKFVDTKVGQPTLPPTETFGPPVRESTLEYM